MAILHGIIGPMAGLFARPAPDITTRAAATPDPSPPPAGPASDQDRVPMAAVLMEAHSADPWTRRARPSFLYVMYALLLWSIPLGLIAAVRPATAQAIAAGMTAYLAGLPEPLYALFGTGYLGYTVARSWGKARGSER